MEAQTKKGLIVQKALFKKILVANRGEIAVRIIKTIQEMRILAVALASDADLTAEHARTADEFIYLPGEKPADTYLQAEVILEQAKAIGVDAIHPGYGFLSENAAFAEACAKAGIVFIGPSPRVIRDMGDKIIAKNQMKSAGVPVVPGWSGNLETEFSTIQREAAGIGYPLLVKAAAGGGGKGMRLVQSPEGLEAAFASAAREAQSAFGDARVFLEKYITRPRHIEFQIFGDHQGNVVHLFERECSIQRRHQKIIEETPSPALNDALRQQMGEAAVKAARAMGYTNAGTVEFILAEDGAFYFLEVNTRLQVEHPVTEMTVHQDLVRLQIAVAAGLPLPFGQADLKQDGHAIECRVYAEDPARNFMPGIGRLAVYRPPNGPFIRLDGGVREGSEVSVHYDPMLAKLIVWGKNREAALQKMSWALSRFALLGVANNLSFLKGIIDHPLFQSGQIHTHFLEENPIAEAQTETPLEVLLLGALSSQIVNKDPAHLKSATMDHDVVNTSPWSFRGGWRQLRCQK
jgi:acetyl-CoA carboxylase biotin carboxylase subunit